MIFFNFVVIYFCFLLYFNTTRDKNMSRDFFILWGEYYFMKGRMYVNPTIRGASWLKWSKTVLSYLSTDELRALFRFLPLQRSSASLHTPDSDAEINEHLTTRRVRRSSLSYRGICTWITCTL